MTRTTTIWGFLISVALGAIIVAQSIYDGKSSGILIACTAMMVVWCTFIGHICDLYAAEAKRQSILARRKESEWWTRKTIIKPEVSRILNANDRMTASIETLDASLKSLRDVKETLLNSAQKIKRESERVEE